MNRQISVTALAAIALTGCSASDKQAISEARVIDSAGIAVVQNGRAHWTPTTAWKLESLPALVIGEDADSSSAVLTGLGPHAKLSDSTLVLVDSPARQLRFYGPNGKPLRTVGRKGSGPGEFGSIGGMFLCVNDTIVVSDITRRISVWDANGTFVRERTLPPSDSGWNPTVDGVSRDCQSILVKERRPVPPAQTSGRHQNRLQWRALGGSAAESVLEFPGIESTKIQYNGLSLTQAVVWSNQPEYSYGGSRLVLGLADAAEYRVYDLHGKLERVVRWAKDPVPVTRNDRANYSAGRDEYLRENPADARTVPPIELLTVAKSKPYYGAIRIDEQNNTWICDCPEKNVLFKASSRAGSTVPWTVFDEAGVLLGTVDIPAQLTVQRISTNEIAGVWRGVDDRQSFRVYRIVKPKM